MGRAELCERLLRCAVGARVAAGRLEWWEADQRGVLADVYLQARGGLGATVPKRVAARLLRVSVSTLDRWIARGAVDTGGAPGSGPDRRAGRLRGLSQVEVTGRVLDDIGCLPWSIAAIENYARARDIPTVKLKAVDRYVAEVTEVRAAAGKWTPTRPPRRGSRPDETVTHDQRTAAAAQSVL